MHAPVEHLLRRCRIWHFEISKYGSPRSHKRWTFTQPPPVFRAPLRPANMKADTHANHRYFLRPRAQKSPRAQPRRKPRLLNNSLRTEYPQTQTPLTSVTPPTSITLPTPSPVAEPERQCRSCHAIPGHLKPLELSRMSREERRKTIDAAWDQIETQESAASPPLTTGTLLYLYASALSDHEG